MMLNRALLIIFVFVFSVSVTKSETFVLKTDSITQDLSRFLYFYKDRAGRSFLDSAIQSNKWQKNNAPSLNFGFTFDNYWIKTSILNKNTTNEYLLNIKFPFLDTLEVYLIYPDKEIKKFTLGDRYVFRTRFYNHKNFVIPLTLYQNQQVDIYFYLRCNGEVTSFPIELTTKELLDIADSRENFALGIYYGIIAFALFLSLFMGIFLKEKTHFYYLLYLVFAFLFQFSLDGLAFQFLWPNNVWLANHIIPISASLSLFFLIFFAATLMRIRTLGKVPNYLYSFFSVVLLIELLMVLPDNEWYPYFIPILSFTALLIDVFLLYLSIVAAKNGNTSARYFIIAFGFLLLMIGLAQLKNFGLLPRVFITEYGIQIGSAIETILLSLALSDRIRALQYEKSLVQQKLLDEQVRTIRLQQKSNEELEAKVKERTYELQRQKEIIEEKNKDISDSINYAERIQKGILQDEKQLRKIFIDSFILFKPKDVVSGDFYWFADLYTTPMLNRPSERVAVIAVADCTGHGIPGAFMSMVGNAILNQTLKNPEVNSPADALNFLNEGVVTTVTKKAENDDNEFIKDGMDIAMVAINIAAKNLWYAGANNPCYIVRKGVPDEMTDEVFTVENYDSYLIELKPDKQAIGVNTNVKQNPFNNKQFQLKSGDAVYLFSDGYADQFGGNKSKKYTTKRFKEDLCRLNHESLSDFGQKLWEIHLNWKHDLPQIDDICVIGVRIP